MSDLAVMPGPVQVCQLEAEFEVLLDIYREQQPMRTLEIGTASGGTLYHFLKNCPEAATIVTVDWPQSGYELPDTDLVETWRPEDATLIQIRGDSHDPDTQAKVRGSGPFDFVFIDGAHPYQDARADWDAYSAMTNPGAVVALHDIALRRTYENGDTAGVHRLWRELQAEGHLTRELRARPNLDAYGIGVIYLP